MLRAKVSRARRRVPAVFRCSAHHGGDELEEGLGIDGLSQAADAVGQARVVEAARDHDDGVGAHRGILVEARDEGPGIPDVAKALQDGYSTSGSLGLGLPGIRRLMDEFEVRSTVGKGTTVSTIKWSGESGWWYEILADHETGMTWAIQEESLEGVSA